MRHSPAAAPATPPAKERSPQGADPRQGEGGQRRRRIAATRHTAGCGPRPCPAPDAARPAAAAPHDTSPANNNRSEEMRTSCRQQLAPPPSDEVKMSPRISIGPDPVLVAHARPRLQMAATARREKVQLSIREQSFFQHGILWQVLGEPQYLKHFLISRNGTSTGTPR